MPDAPGPVGALLPEDVRVAVDRARSANERAPTPGRTPVSWRQSDAPILQLADEAAIRFERLRMSGILRYLSDAGIDALVERRLCRTPALVEVHAWLRADLPVLGLFGDVDAGKTVAAGFALASGNGGQYVKAHALEGLRWGDYNRPSPHLETICRCPLLVIDELGGEDDADRTRQVLDQIILDGRQVARRRTLLLGNLKRRQFEERMGVRIMSRLRHTARFAGVAATGLRAKHRPEGW